MPEPAIVCRGLSKTYETSTGGIEALHDVAASFALGEITAVVGVSGSGKSTLLRVVAALDRPTKGSLVVAGHELAGAPPSELRRHRRETVTYVSQKPAENFVPHLKVGEHAEANADVALRLLDEFGLSQRLGSKPIELSGGEQARAAFALALARDTRIVVADEPTAELDRASAQRLLGAIRSHAGGGTSFVLATHDPDVISIADRVLRLERGRVVDPGERAERSTPVRARPAGGERVALSNVSKSFRLAGETIRAVRGVNLELRPGELGVVLGRSGSGKSTLLMLLAGWQRPDTGGIRFDFSASSPAALRWHELAIVPQRFGLLPELSVRENVEYPARLAGTLRGRSASIEALLAELGLDELADRPPHETSIGQQQRTALARALAFEPAVLIADEPTSHQDAGWRDAVWNQLVRAAAQGTSCLIATHEEEAERYGSRVWQLAEGAIVAA